MDSTRFIQSFSIKDGMYLLCKGNVEKANFHYLSKLKIEEERDEQLFFTPAQFKPDSKGWLKENVLGSKYLWVDVDDEELPKLFLPPTYIVNSGHGYHLYYLLDTPIYDIALIEQLNKLLLIHTPNGDKATFNANRFLRIPDSLNMKREPYKRVKIIAHNPIKYSIADIQILRKINKKTKHKVITGDSRGFKSRSERDYNVILSLIKSGASDYLITQLYKLHTIGDKAEEAHDTYLPRTIAKVRASLPNQDENNIRGIIEKEDGYYYAGAKNEVRLSTFTIEPLLLVDGSELDTYDALIVNIHSLDKTWNNIKLSKEAFTSVRALDKECNNINWIWLANDSYLRKLLPYLLEKLNARNTPTTTGIPYTGLVKHNSNFYFIGTDTILSKNKILPMLESPVTWVAQQHIINTYLNVPHTTYKEHQNLKKIVGKHLPKLNNKDVIWIMIGWYSIALLKPYLESINRRLPILSVTGTKGSGKTTLIKMFMQLMGQKQPKVYDSNTTRFVILSLLGSSYSFPIAFSEFRYEAVQHFLRFILLSYDTGNDARGTANQTINTYPLIAPFTLDGEDELIDPAVKERIVTAKLSASTVKEGSQAYVNFKAFINEGFFNFGSMFINYLLCLLHEDKIQRIINLAEKSVFKYFPQSMPDRIRNNHTLVLAGCYLFSDFVGIRRPNAKVLEKSIKAVFNLESQRATLLVDTFIEYVVNTIALNNASNFNYVIDNVSNTISFQLATAYPAWVTYRKRVGAIVLEREAIRSQLQEVEYYKTSGIINNTFMYTIDLKKAIELGLDIPSKIEKLSIDISWQ